MTSNLTMVRNGSIALIAFVLLALPFGAAHAADDSYSYDYSYPVDSGDSYDYSYPVDNGYSYDYSYPVDNGYSYDYSYPVGSDYAPSYNGGSYLGGGYVAGPSYLSSPSRPITTSAPQTQNQNQAQTQSQTSNNTNTNVNNNVITINAPTPTVVYNTPTPAPVYNYPVCNLYVNNYQPNYQNGYNYQYQPVTLSWNSQYAISGYISNGVGSVSLSGSITVNPQYTTTYTGTFYGQNGQTVTCSATVTRGPVAYNPTPYISLSQLPYTGLDLGFWGTIAYWGFLVAWCLVAAYLIVVKKIQNKILRSLGRFLFGETTPHTATLAVAGTSSAVVHTPAQTYSAPIATPQVDAIDEFILSQVNRGRRA